MKQRKEIGNIKDTRCKQNSIRIIGRQTCRNECSQYQYDPKTKKRRCILGY